MASSPDINVRRDESVEVALRVQLAALRSVEAKFVALGDPTGNIHVKIGDPVEPVTEHAKLLRLLMREILRIEINPDERGRLPSELRVLVRGGGKVHVELEAGRVRAVSIFGSGSLVQDVGRDVPLNPAEQKPILDATKTWATTVANDTAKIQ